MSSQEHEHNEFKYIADYSKEKVLIKHNKRKPKHIFKFYAISKYSIDALINGYLYASHPIELNDILDSSPFLIYTSKKLDFSFYERLLGEAYGDNKEDLIKFYNKDTNRDNLCKSYISSMFDVASTLFGIISITEKENNTLMWPHYTQEKGFQIKFKTKELEDSLINNLSDNEEYLGFYPINYCEKLTPIDISKFQNFSIPLYYSTNVKSQKWKYEDEWRILIGKQNMSVPYSKNSFDPRDDYFIDYKNRYAFYNKESVEEITLGMYFFNGREFEIDWIDEKKIKVKPRNSKANWEYKNQVLLLNYIVENLKEKLFYSGLKYELDENNSHYIIRTKEKMKIEKTENEYFLLTRTNKIIKFL